MVYEQDHDMTTEKENEKPLDIQYIGTLGFGQESSDISFDKYSKSAEFDPKLNGRIVELITSGELLKDVNEKDDGCIDGRLTAFIKMYIARLKKFEVKASDNSDHNRAKVAGGGYTTSVAMRIGTGNKGVDVDSDYLSIGALLTDLGVFCGGHTADPNHVHGDGIGCGAIDKLKEILTIKPEDMAAFKKTVGFLIESAGVEFNGDLFDEIMDEWASAVADEAYFANSTGKSKLNAIESVLAVAQEEKAPEGSEKPLGVIKELAGQHKEAFVVINYVKGKSFSQTDLAVILHKEFPDIDLEKLPQVFVVDAWRVVELAEKGSSKEDFESAVISGVAYQVATAAELTDGTLQMYMYKN